MNLKDIISKNLKELRAKSQSSQEAFAKRAGMHQRSYGRLESGEHWASIESLEKISKAYRIDLSMLLSSHGISKHPLDDFKNDFDEANEIAQQIALDSLENLKNYKEDMKIAHNQNNHPLDAYKETFSNLSDSDKDFTITMLEALKIKTR